MNLFQRTMRRIISVLANTTPNVVYYQNGWVADMNGKLERAKAKRGGKGSPMTTAAIALSCALHEHLPKVGDSATMTLVGVSHGGEDIGHFEVTAKRIDEQ